MIWFLTKLKAYWWALVGVVFGTMAVAIKFLTHRNAVLRDRAEYAKAYANRAKVIADMDNEIEAQKRSHRAEVKHELEDNRIPDAFDPNKLRRKSDD